MAAALTGTECGKTATRASSKLCRQPRTQRKRPGSGGIRMIAAIPRRLTFVSFLSVSFVFLSSAFVPLAESQTQPEATRLLQQYVSIDTSNPPGDTKKAADFLASVL